jgi:ABC-type transport system involved in multi-copper enzyme maturation permease subunit
MLATLITKELKAIIQSPKFVGSFAVCSILILLSVFTGIREYQAAVKQYDAASTLVDEQLKQEKSWFHFTTKTYRAPDPMQVFVSGLSYDIGRWSGISSNSGVKLLHSAYSDDPIFAVFRIIDFAFIVMFVLSLMAIQFTYDAVNGERESGTLKLVFSNAVPRAKYLIAKCAGSWLGLVVPMGIPVLIALLMVIGAGVPMTYGHWIKVGVLLGLSLLLFTVFILLGVLVSTITRRSSVSFLLALLIWVAFVMIIPRSGVMAAGGLVDVPRASEIESQREAFANEKWQGYIGSVSTRCPVKGTLEHNADSRDTLKEAMDNEIEAYDAQLREGFRQRKIRQETIAWNLSRLSPASAYQLAAMSLAGTDTESKARSEDDMNRYREQLNQYAMAKQAESGGMGGIRITMSMDEQGKTNLSVDASRAREGLDISDMPRFKASEVSLGEAIGPTVADFGILGFDILFIFAAAFVAFLKYDLR